MEGGLGEGDYIDPQTLQDMEDIASWAAETALPTDALEYDIDGAEGTSGGTALILKTPGEVKDVLSFEYSLEHA